MLCQGLVGTSSLETNYDRYIQMGDAVHGGTKRDQPACTVIAHGVNFETALSYALWDVALKKMSCGGGGLVLIQIERQLQLGQGHQRGQQ